MKNLHLMPMGSVFEDNIILQLNACMPLNKNIFVLRHERTAVADATNCIVDPLRFSVEYINSHYQEYHRIVLHSLFLSPSEILQLCDDAAKKMIWCVWGHDLYDNRVKQKLTSKKIVHESIHALKKLLRGTYIRMYRNNQKLRAKVSLFHGIAIGFPYDELMIRKKYGHKVPVYIAPYFSDVTKDDLLLLRKKHQEKPKGAVNVLIGHSGYEFLEHEKYLKLLSRYATENIHINMVLSYGASQDRIDKLTKLAYDYFGKDKCSILTEMMSQREYFSFLSQMDIAIFGYKHQSALDNTKVLAFSGAKMYFNQEGALAKGFSLGGVPSFDCHRIGSIHFSDLIKNETPINVDAHLFDTYCLDKNLEAWNMLLK